MSISPLRLTMRAFGGTCPMCCGDLDDVAYIETGAAVCVYCGHKHVERTLRARGQPRSILMSWIDNRVGTVPGKWHPFAPIAR
jgi:hypothetical protein